jgi:hypothetical protein
MAASFTGLAGAIIFLLARKLISVELGMLMRLLSGDGSADGQSGVSVHPAISQAAISKAVCGAPFFGELGADDREKSTVGRQTTRAQHRDDVADLCGVDGRCSRIGSQSDSARHATLPRPMQTS